MKEENNLDEEIFAKHSQVHSRRNLRGMESDEEKKQNALDDLATTFYSGRLNSANTVDSSRTHRGLIPPPLSASSGSDVTQKRRHSTTLICIKGRY